MLVSAWIVASVNTGLGAQPAIAQPQATAVVQQIDNKTSDQQQPSWDSLVGQQLTRRDQQIAAAQAAAAAAEAQRQAEIAQERAAAIAQAAPALSGNCSVWLANAGVSDIADAEYLINRESGCNPNAVNPSSGACGVAQELPCGKSGCTLGDGQCEVIWMNQYVIDRYGSWANAAAHERAYNWY